MIYGHVPMDIAPGEYKPSVILASHQPDFLPYSGFFYKIAKASVFDLAIYDDYSHQGYQRRVKIGGKWVSLVVNKSDWDRKPIWQVDYERASVQRVIDAIYQEHHRDPYFKKYAPAIFSELVSNPSSMAVLNINLIGLLAQMLGLNTPIMTAIPLTKPKGHGILQLMDFYKADTYLSGNGAQAYIGDEFEKAGKRLVWSTHNPITENSVLEILFNYESPMDYILRERIYEHPTSEAPNNPEA